MKQAGVAAILLTAFPAFALPPDAGWYIGFGAGQGQIKDAPEDKSTGGKAFLGYQFNRILAIEGGYARLGGFDAGRTEAAFADAVVMIPLSKWFSVIGKAGLVRTRMTTGSASASDNTTAFGFGADWNFDRNLKARLEWERFREVGDKDVSGESDVDFLSFSLIWKY